MMKMKKIVKPLLILMPVFVLQGCGSFKVEEYLPDKKVEYKKSKQVGNDLELPPDLTNVRVGSELHVPTATTASGVATYSQFLGEKSISGQRTSSSAAVLPQVDNIALKREGKERWLVIQNPPQEVGPNVVSFWKENSILLIEQDPTVGVMKTGWLENRADIDSDIVTDTVRRLFDGLYSAATRDQYRVRLEEGDEPGTTEVYLTHYGMQEEIKVDTAGEAERSVWIPRGTDPGLEAEMLRRLMVHMGVQEQRAQSLVSKKSPLKAKRSQLIRNAQEVRLSIAESFAKSWRLTGLALDRVGFAVEDRDRSSGIYYVRYNDPMASADEDDGWLSKLKFWGGSAVEEDERFQILVASRAGASEVVVLDEQGQRLVTETAERILSLIHEQIQ